MSGGSEPRFEIRNSDVGVSKGPYFVLIDTEGDEVHESNVYYLGSHDEREQLCRKAAAEELDNWKSQGKIK